MSYKRLGDYIQKVDVRNTELITDELLGINIDNYFMPSVANIIGTDLSRYKLVFKDQFACNRMHVGRDDRMPLAISKNEKPFIVSPAYDVFEIIDTGKLLSDYLMMWMKRAEFDRECWFHTDADVRGGLPWEDFEDLTLPIPSIEKQRQIVADYQAVENKIKTNEAICEKLEETAQTIYRRWFEEFEFPCLPSDYRPHGQVNQTLPMDEYIAKIGSICTYKRVGGLPISDGKSWFVYLILCEDDSIYKGMTNDLYRRFYEHYIDKGAEWTKVHKPLKVVHWEQFDTKEEAAKREKDLKTGYGRTWISRQIEKAGGIENLKTGLPAPKTLTSHKTSLPAPKTQLRTAGKMVWNEELEKDVPEGWEVRRLEDEFEITIGRTPSRNEEQWFSVKDIDYKWISIKDLNENGIFILDTNEKLTHNAVKKFNIPVVPENTLILSFKMSIGSIGITLEPSLTNEAIAHFIKTKTTIISNEFLYFYFKCYNFHTLGTTSSIVNSINTKIIRNLYIIKPTIEILKFYTDAINPYLKRILNLEKQNQKLQQLQELLLASMTREDIEIKC